MDATQKKNLRRRVLALRDHLSATERMTLEKRLLAQILALDAVRDGQVFFIYCNYKTEVSTKELIDQLLLMGKTVCVPLSDPSTTTLQAVVVTNPHTQLIPGYKGIPEPSPDLVPGSICGPEYLEVAIIPGSVFDRRGYRLGYGGGYYDRFLTRAAPQALRIGLAFSLQVVERIQEQPHDVPMDVLVTEKEVHCWPRTRTSHPIVHRWGVVDC
jgi:5-formyltetrahydrofolate cyclo-ligase